MEGFIQERERSSNEGIYCVDKPFFSNIVDCAATNSLVPRAKVSKVIIIGSGGLSIGQAGEFGYIKALSSYTIMVNRYCYHRHIEGSRGQVYFLPVTPESVRKSSHQLKDEFKELGVRVKSGCAYTFRELSGARAMEEIRESAHRNALLPMLLGLLIIVRAAYALGGLGLGFAQNETHLRALCSNAFVTSLMSSLRRDFDPLGIHMRLHRRCPSQTLSDSDYNMLRTTAINIIRHLGFVLNVTSSTPEPYFAGVMHHRRSYLWAAGPNPQLMLRFLFGAMRRLFATMDLGRLSQDIV
ncbi:hypothetical protein BDQ17DRAFT_1424625 [Cyathus striatus]|nr:hypothetical protein BDQ17DRAFT_1424625 [Cyathus striatus]